MHISYRLDSYLLSLLLSVYFLSCAHGSPLSFLHLQQQAIKCPNPSVRVEWRNMRHADRVEYLQAERCLFNAPGKTEIRDVRNRYEDFIAVHQGKTNEIHDTSLFLPWHRYFLHVHETLLRSECNYTGPIPWWDETKDAGKFEKSPLFTSSYFGKTPMQVGEDKTPCLDNGAFAGTTLHIGPGTVDKNIKHCLSRAINNDNSQWIDQYFLDYCNDWTDYTQMWKCLSNGPHAYGHIALYGEMRSLPSAVGDPIFFLHHAFIDRSWAIWQMTNPGNNLFQVNGPVTQSSRAPKLTLDFKLTSRGLLPDVATKEVMNIIGGYLCYTYDY